MAAKLAPLWVIDDVEVVHTHRCADILHPIADYFTAPRSATTLIEHLARPDIANGHTAPSNLVPCDNCVRGAAEIEGASK